jgi:hypothetical protein
MEDYDVHIRADVVGTCIVLGTQLNVHDLSKERHFLRYRNAVTLKVRFWKRTNVCLDSILTSIISFRPT